MSCELCRPVDMLFESELAYVRHDSNPLSRGHLLIVPRRHVASYFDLTLGEQTQMLQLLDQAHRFVEERFRPDGYNIGANVGRAAGQNRMHVHFHLIPRYAGDVPDPSGGIRRALTG